MKKVDNFSQFNIFASQNLSSDDMHVLALFYKPLIGSNAFSLYLLFSSLLERNNLESVTISHQDLFDISDLNNVSFLNARLKLEAVGLLKTYYDKVNYAYLLKTPFSPKQFVTDGVLGQYLFSQIGEKMFNLLLNKFKIRPFEKNDFSDITVSFDQVFETKIPTVSLNDKENYLLGKLVSKGVNVTNHDFSFDEFLQGFNKSFLEFGVTEDFKRQILSIAYVYGYDEGDMQNLAIRSLNKAQFFDYRKLKNEASAQFHSRYDTRPAIAAKDLKEENNQIQEMIDLTAMQILRNHNPAFTDKEQDIVTKIYSDINLNKGVLNFMLNKALIDKSGEVQAFNYYKKMGDNWISRGINTPQLAYNFVNNIKEEKPKRTRNSNKKSSEWVEQLVKNIDEGTDYL